jgi:hypothetical protein
VDIHTSACSSPLREKVGMREDLTCDFILLSPTLSSRRGSKIVRSIYNSLYFL